MKIPKQKYPILLLLSGMIFIGSLVAIFAGWGAIFGLNYRADLFYDHYASFPAEWKPFVLLEFLMTVGYWNTAFIGGIICSFPSGGIFIFLVMNSIILVRRKSKEDQLEVEKLQSLKSEASDGRIQDISEVILYTQPKDIVFFPKMRTDLGRASREIVNEIDPRSVSGFKGGLGRNVRFQGFIPSWDLEIVIETKTQGGPIQEENLVSRITLSGPVEKINDFINRLIKRLNRIPWVDINWEKISKKFKVSTELTKEGWENFEIIS